MERELKKYGSCVDPALPVFISRVSDHLNQYPIDLQSLIASTFLHLNFLKMFFWGLGFPEELLGADWMLRFTFTVQTFKRTAEDFRMKFEAASEGEKITKWKAISDPLLTVIQDSEQKAREICILLLDGPLECKSSYQHKGSSHEYGQETREFIGLIQNNLRALVDTIAPDLVQPIVKERIDFLERKLEVFGDFVSVQNLWRHRYMGTDELIYHIQIWASRISCLVFLYWIDGTDEIVTFASEKMLSDLMQKIMFYNPGTTALFLDVFKATKYHRCRGKWFNGLLFNYVDFLLEHVVLQHVNNDIELLHEGLLFLLSFVMDSSNGDSKETELILAEIYAIVTELQSVGCISEANQLSYFLHKIDGVKAKVRELYFVTPLSSRFNSPLANPLGFLDSLLETLHQLLEGAVHFISSVKNHVVGIHEGLASLRPFLECEFEPKSEGSRVKTLLTKIINVIHYASYVTKLCHTMSFSVWFGILCLPDVEHQIELVTSEVKKIEYDLYVNSCKNFIGEIESSNTLPQQVPPSKDGGAFIGFQEDVKSITDYLLGGQKDLTIISISGMPGQGKTTLAKRMYDDPSIQYHFHRVAWGYVSKDCKIKNLLANFFWDDSDNKDYDRLDIHDLANLVRKSLKQRRYFIVLDDIWDVDVWYQVRDSFPNDKNGSRILFTTRYQGLASQCRPNSICHPLRLFSVEESWELMKDKLSSSKGCTSELSEVGKQIALYCQGLPLAVVLITSHLKRTTQELDSWMEVKENLKSHLASERFMYIMGLSYKYLPRHLKPCFLYCGLAFQRGEIIFARKLIRLWIAEGFVKEKEMLYSEDLAREYLDYLVAHNLVIVLERGSTGKLKLCIVHDLLYDFCIQKAMEYNFLQLAGLRILIKDSYQPSSQKYNFHHHCLCIHDNDPACDDVTYDSTRKELPTSPVHSLFWSLHATLITRYDSLSSFLNNFQVLTVLDMMEVYLHSSKFPEAIFYNSFLKYLALRGSFYFVPPSIDCLWRLETLLLSSVHLLLPESLWSITTLSYVRVRNGYLDLGSHGQDMSSEVATSNIETLNGVILPYDVKMQQFLRSLPRLRKLHCSYYIDFHPKWLSMFGSLRKLESLTIDKVDRVLFPKHGWRNLSINFPGSLKKLCLKHLGLPWRAMSTIGKLPNLQVLKLCHNACEGATWDLGDEDFLQLKYLKLEMVDVKQINDSDCEYPFPCLEKLFVYNCKRLEEIPSSFGAIITLNTIHLISSPQASDSVKAIVEQQKDMGNELHSVVLDHDVKGHVNDEENERDDYDDNGRPMKHYKKNDLLRRTICAANCDKSVAKKHLRHYMWHIPECRNKSGRKFSDPFLESVARKCGTFAS